MSRFVSRGLCCLVCCVLCSAAYVCCFALYCLMRGRCCMFVWCVLCVAFLIVHYVDVFVMGALGFVLCIALCASRVVYCSVACLFVFV